MNNFYKNFPEPEMLILSITLKEMTGNNTFCLIVTLTIGENNVNCILKKNVILQ